MPGVIVPEKIPLGDRNAPQPPARPPGRGWIAVVLAVAAVVGCGALAVIMLSSRSTPPSADIEPEIPQTDSVAAPVDTQEQAIAADIPAEPEIDPATLLLDRERAESRLGDFLEKKQELDRNAVLEWGDQDYALVLAVSKSADQAFLNEEFASAVNAYEEAIAHSDALIARIPGALTDLLEAGDAALGQANGELAKRKFQAALDIDPTRESASAGLQRARTIERVASLMQSGTTYERSQQYALALTDFQEAARLDPLHPDAGVAVTRVSERIREAKFRQLMSKALRAIEKEELDEGEAILKEAESFYPDSEDIADARFRIAETRRLIRIRDLLDFAREAESTEHWKQAYDTFGETLEIDPHIAEAVSGKERTGDRIRLLGQMKYYLDHPGELNSEQTRKHAKVILNEAKDLAGEEPKWSRDVSAFDEAVIAATTPVSVVITSDGRTSVDVYRVGRFGAFESKDLSLLPGTYTVVGHRKGYKDVRLEIKVVPGSEIVRTRVSCLDPI
jgi:tetratricopeptide (TPR) repeat protein